MKLGTYMENDEIFPFMQSISSYLYHKDNKKVFYN